jgi:hypothetical protein
MSAINNPAFPMLDDTSRKILDVVSAEAFLSNRYLTVKELIEMTAIGSKANLHTRLHGLVEAGYLKLVPQADARFTRRRKTNGDQEQPFYRAKRW